MNPTPDDHASASMANPTAVTESGSAATPPGFFSRLGPGLITGAADDDPSGIGTHS